jgi:hypothetical protein
MAKNHAVANVSDTQATGKVYEVMMEVPSSDPNKVEFYCMGVTTPYSGRARWVTLNKADSNATKDAAVRAALLA